MKKTDEKLKIKKALRGLLTERVMFVPMAVSKGFFLFLRSGDMRIGRRTKDLTDHKYGKLTVREISHKDERRKVYWKCKCDCGNKATVRADQLTRNKTRSCGCLAKETLFTRERSTTHGLSGTKLYDLYNNMISRCYKNKNSRNYKNYGGRGIKVCNEWLESRPSFFNWVLDNGYKPWLEIDRKNNDGNYSPENCIFVTHKENNANKRTTRHFIIYGKYYPSAKDAAKTFKVSGDTIRHWCGLDARYIAKEGCLSFRPNV